MKKRICFGMHGKPGEIWKTKYPEDQEAYYVTADPYVGSAFDTPEVEAIWDEIRRIRSWLDDKYTPVAKAVHVMKERRDAVAKLNAAQPKPPAPPIPAPAVRPIAPVGKPVGYDPIEDQSPSATVTILLILSAALNLILIGILVF